MARTRSPNYPSMSLPDAISLVCTAYPKAHRHKSDKAAIANLFGYTSLNGASLTVLAALSQYGLLEGKKEAMGISEDGETIAIEPPGSKPRLEAIERCANNPAVFQEMLANFSEDLPADEIVRPFLIRKGFSVSSADGPIRALRETLAFVKDERSLYNSKQKKESDEFFRSVFPPPGGKTKPHSPGVGEQPPKNTPPNHPGEAMTQDSFTLSEGQVVLQYPTKLSEESLEYLDMWLQLQLKKARGTFKKSQLADDPEQKDIED
ncbi:MAG: hypothetical protein AB2796_20495 [Candidatus Thiodiazotropha sp.]